MLTYKIEENKDGSWGDVRTTEALTTYDVDQYKGLIEGDEKLSGVDLKKLASI